MKRTGNYFIIASLFILLFTACDKGGDDENIVPGYLESFSEYVATKSLAAADIKGYLEQYGQTDLAILATYDIQIFKIEYKTAFEGDSILASGIVVIPTSKKSSDAFPMMSYQHGVILSKSEAPSVNPLSAVSEFPSYIASTGMIVLIPDYIGYGASDNYNHPFMIKTSLTSSLLDFIRASKEFIASEKPCKTNGNLFLSGYGEGATATLAALNEIESDTVKYDDLKVKASGCGSGVYNLIRFREWLVTQSKFDQPWYFAYILESYRQYAGLDIDYSLVLNEPFASKIPGMVDGTKAFEQLNELFGSKSVDKLLTNNFIDNYTFNNSEEFAEMKEILAENVIPAWILNSKVTIYYGKNDTWVPADQSLIMYSDFKNLGVTTKLKINAMEGLDHESAVIPILVKSVNWFKTF